jgi:hypothetical protein
MKEDAPLSQDLADQEPQIETLLVADFGYRALEQQHLAGPGFLEPGLVDAERRARNIERVLQEHHRHFGLGLMADHQQRPAIAQANDRRHRAAELQQMAPAHGDDSALEAILLRDVL